MRLQSAMHHSILERIAVCISICVFTPLVIATESEGIENEYTDGLVWTLDTSYTNHSFKSTREFDHALVANWYGPLNDTIDAMLKLTLQHEHQREKSAEETIDTFLQISESWLQTDVSGFTMRLGHQSFEDDRGWWWDDQRLGVSIHSEPATWLYSVALFGPALELSTTKQEADPEVEDLMYLLLQAKKTYADGGEFSLYGLRQTDQSGIPAATTLVESNLEDERDADLTHLGMGISQELGAGDFGQLNLYADLAIVTGHEHITEFDEEVETSDDSALEETESADELPTTEDSYPELVQVSGTTRTTVNAWGLDLSLRWALPLEIEPSIGLGFAHGSGTSEQTEKRNNTFRQSSLHDSELYGSVFAPELSNLQVFSISLSAPVTGKGEISVFHHRYRKVVPDGVIPKNELDVDSDSNGSIIGNETSFIFNWKLFEDAELSLSFSQFSPSKLFTVTNPYNRFEIDISYEF